MINLRSLSDGELANEAERLYPNISREMAYELIYRVRRAAGKTLEPSNSRGERIGGIDPAPINVGMVRVEGVNVKAPIVGRFPHARK